MQDIWLCKIPRTPPQGDNTYWWRTMPISKVEYEVEDTTDEEVFEPSSSSKGDSKGKGYPLGAKPKKVKTFVKKTGRFQKG